MYIFWRFKTKAPCDFTETMISKSPSQSYPNGNMTKREIIKYCLYLINHIIILRRSCIGFWFFLFILVQCKNSQVIFSTDYKPSNSFWLFSSGWFVLQVFHLCTFRFFWPIRSSSGVCISPQWFNPSTFLSLSFHFFNIEDFSKELVFTCVQNMLTRAWSFV